MNQTIRQIVFAVGLLGMGAGLGVAREAAARGGSFGPAHGADYHDGDIYWCTADIGWVTGHSYIVYGPLQNGATSIMFEGVPTYPKPDRF